MKILSLLFPAIGFFSSASSKPDRPHILWITGENFSNDLACYGQKPRIDFR